MKQAVDAADYLISIYFLIFFFTSCKVIRDLVDQGLSAAGTIRKERLDNCPFPSVEEMKKLDSGSYTNQ